MIVTNDILSNTANFTLPLRARLFHAAHCKAGRGNCCRNEKFEILVGMQLRHTLLLSEF